jgi:A1 cistron-splicing factor AAR2
MAAPAAALYEVRLRPDDARALASAGAALLLLDVPPGTAVGVDRQTFLVGGRFLGLKMVPPGPHVLTHAAAGGARAAGGGFGPTTALFIHARGGQTLAWRWSAAEEALIKIEDEEELQRLDAAVRSFSLDRNLAPYDLASLPAWQALAGAVSPALLARVAPPRGAVCAAGEPARGRRGAPPTAAEAALEAQLAAGTARRAAAAAAAAAAAGAPPAEPAAAAAPPADAESAAARAAYSPFPRLVKRPGLAPAELTAANLDKSAALEALLAAVPLPRGAEPSALPPTDAYAGLDAAEAQLVGEFQFAFLAFLLGHSLEGFAQWRALLCLAFSCRAAPLGARSGLFAALLRALRAQLAQALGPAPAAPTDTRDAPARAGGGRAGAADADAAAVPLGELVVDELLVDSFLRREAAAWLRWLARAPGAPAGVAAAGAAVGALLRARLGWDCGGGARELGARGGGDDEEGSSEAGSEDSEGPVVVDPAELIALG